MKYQILKWKTGLILFLLLVSAPGCSILTPKQSVMKTSVAKTTTRKTSRPRVFTSGAEIVAVGQEEEIVSEVEYGKSSPVVKRRSIWTRWWWWLLILAGVTYLGLWPLVFRLVKKLREKTHALVTLVKQVDVYKESTDKGSAAELKTILKTQDPITKKQVDEIRSGK